MKILRILILAAAATLAPAALAQIATPHPPTLQNALKLTEKQAVIFRPVQMPANLNFSLTHIRMGDGSVKPGETRGALLVIYSAQADEDGNHAVLDSQFHQFTKTGSPVKTFPAFRPSRDAANFVANGRCGIIAILIGMIKTGNDATFRPTNLPGTDTISAEIVSDDPQAIGLLLPAVQKVRAAAARL